MVHGNSIDETGKKYGRWTVLELSLDRSKQGSAWLCRCDCGNEKIVSGVALRRGSSESCGCLQKELVSKRRLLSNNAAAKNSFIQSRRYAAKRRGLSFNLPDEFVLSLCSKDCHYCGVEPSFTHRANGSKSRIIYNGIDRVDNNIGYEINNVVPCCFACNIAKLDRSKNEFLKWVKRVYEYNF